MEEINLQMKNIGTFIQENTLPESTRFRKLSPQAWDDSIPVIEDQVYE